MDTKDFVITVDITEEKSSGRAVKRGGDAMEEYKRQMENADQMTEALKPEWLKAMERDQIVVKNLAKKQNKATKPS